MALCCRQWRTKASLGSWFLQLSENHGNLQPTWREIRNFTNKQWNFATLEFPTHVRTNCPYWKKEHWPGVSMTEGTLLMMKLWFYPILSKNIDTTDSCKNTTHFWFQSIQSMHASLVKCSFFWFELIIVLDHERHLHSHSYLVTHFSRVTKKLIFYWFYCPTCYNHVLTNFLAMCFQLNHFNPNCRLLNPVSYP